MTRGWGLFWGLVLVLVGGLALLYNSGLLVPEQLARVLALWPLLLIIVGLQIVLARLLPRNVAAIALSVIAVLLVAASVGYVVGAPPARQVHKTFTAVDHGAGPALLKIEVGAAAITVRAGSPAGVAAVTYGYTTGFGGDPQLSWDRSSRTLQVSRQGGGANLFGSTTPDHVNVTLDGSIRWAVELDTGASSANLDFRDGSLQRLTVNGGATSIDAVLGAPAGLVPVSISGGASQVHLSRPPAAAIRVTVNGGADSLQVDGHDQGGGIGSVSWSSSSWPAGDAYDVTVEGGANRVRVDVAGGGT